MTHQAIVGNMGHSDVEVEVAALNQDPGLRRVPVKPQVDEWVFPDGHSVILLSRGRALNLGNATGNPSFIMSHSFANQVLAQVELYTRAGSYGAGVHGLPRLFDEKVARLHLAAVGASLTSLTNRQAEVLGVPVTGPFKSPGYHY
jgi:adenosylhomocysteinase